MIFTPEQIAEPGTEHSHQAAIFQFVATVGAKAVPDMKRLFAIPNGADYGGDANRKGVTGARMKAEGLKKGIPDMFWPWAPDIHSITDDTLPPGLWIELKKPNMQNRKDGDRSPEQVDYHLWLRAQGWPVVTAYGWKDACWSLVYHARGLLQMPDGGDCLFAHGSMFGPGLEDFNR